MHLALVMWVVFLIPKYMQTLLNDLKKLFLGFSSQSFRVLLSVNLNHNLLPQVSMVCCVCILCCFQEIATTFLDSISPSDSHKTGKIIPAWYLWLKSAPLPPFFLPFSFLPLLPSFFPFFPLSFFFSYAGMIQGFFVFSYIWLKKTSRLCVLEWAHASRIFSLPVVAKVRRFWSIRGFFKCNVHLVTRYRVPRIIVAL